MSGPGPSLRPLVLWAALCSTGCGMLTFAFTDPPDAGEPAGDAASPPGDAALRDAAVDDAGCEEQPERCNGVDDDCNDEIDEGCICTATHFTVVSDDDERSMVPSLAVSSDGVGVVWADARHGSLEVYVAVVDAAGALQGENRLTITSDESIMPSLVWTGDQFGLAWVERSEPDYEIHFMTLNPDGTPLSVEVCVSCQSQLRSIRPSLAWNGARFGLAWQEAGDGYLDSVWFTSFDSVDEVPSGHELSGEPAAARPSLVGDGQGDGDDDGWAVAWSQQDAARQIYVARIDASGQLRVSATPVTAATADSTWPSLARTESGFGLSWLREASASTIAVFAAALDGDGRLVGSEILLGEGLVTGFDPLVPSAAGAGSVFGVAYAPEASVEQPHLWRFDGAGRSVGESLVVDGPSDLDLGLSLAATEAGYALAFSDLVIGSSTLNSEIVVVQLSCPTE